MKLVLLGTTGYHPNDRRHTACMMLPEQGIVLDAGTAMYRVRDYLCATELNIFLTHVHLDHVVGLSFLIDIVHGKPLERVTVHAAPDKLQAVREHLLHPALFPAPLPCEFRPLASEVPLVGGGRLTHFPVMHPGGAVGFRLDWPGHALAYVTDTTAAEDAEYVAAIRGVDLLVHECNFPDSDAALAARTGHSTATPVAQVARRAGVGRLVLVHVNPLADSEAALELDNARPIFPNLVVAHDRMEIEF
ncbi:MAG TPA: MBL fold metallo-hydrolase [Pirellulales bacterium]|nr:MBL fold metallo-hydrolase [Pirellulales bacterium]